MTLVASMPVVVPQAFSLEAVALSSEVRQEPLTPPSPANSDQRRLGLQNLSRIYSQPVQ
jgi:hypothetical protein